MYVTGLYPRLIKWFLNKFDLAINFTIDYRIDR